VSTVEDFSFGDDIEIVSASDAQVAWVKLLAYGPSGWGKTNLMATMPDPMIVLLMEGHGDMTIKRVNPNAKIIYVKNQVEIVNGKPKVTLKASEIIDRVVTKLGSGQSPYISLVVDSLTELQQVYLDDSKGGVPGADVSLKEWGKLIDRTKHLIRRLRDLNMHVGVICLADEVQDQNSRMIYRPALAGKKLPGSVIQYFNLCCFQRKTRDSAAVGGSVYEAVFDAGDEYYTKTHPALDPVEPPTVRGFIDKIARYAKEHNEGDMPTQSSPISTVAQQQNAEDKQRDRLENKELKEMFDTLAWPKAKVLAELEKHDDDQELLASLKTKVDALNALLEDEEIKELFDKLGAPHKKRVATCREHSGKKDKIVTVLKKALAKKEGK
jgi:hypothetical protein